MKRVLIVCMVGAFLVFSTVIPTSATDSLPTIKWKFAEPAFPKGSDRMNSCERIAKAVSERTGGKFTLSLFGPELGDWVEVDEMVMRGAMDMTLNSMPATYDPRWNIVFCPYIVATYEEAGKAYGPGGFLNEMFREWAQDSDMVWLGTWIQGFSGVSLSTRPAATPEEAEGIKIRVPPIAAFECYWKALGFTPVLIPYSEVPTAISTKMVDGQAGGGPFQTWSCCRDLNKYFVWYRDFMDPCGYTANVDSWNALPPEYKKILEEEVTREVRKRFTDAEQWDRNYIEKLEKEHGFVVVDLAEDPEKLAAARDAARSCWKVMDDLVGKLWMDKIRKHLGMPIK